MLRCVLGVAACLMSTSLTAAESLSDEQRSQFERRIGELKQLADALPATGRAPVGPDVAIFAKAAHWIVKHNEFHKPDYVKWTTQCLEVGFQRATAGKSGQAVWRNAPGKIVVLGYVSTVDGSLQPFAVTLPKGFDAKTSRRWPLHVDLHGRGDTMNEVSWIASHEGKSPKDISDQYILLEPFGRTNNAYRWSGETDVFEAIEATKRLYRIDDQRMTIRGFSMGGAGAWHLGLHHPSKWSSAGAGAGFVDTVVHLNLKAPLSPFHQKLTRIYDAERYAVNAANVPIIGYGGELDKQVFASTRMHALAKEAGVEIPQLIGPKTEHKFHPESLKEFMAFHEGHTKAGRPASPGRKSIRFTTYTPRYGMCEWATIEEQMVPYEASTVEGGFDANRRLLTLKTANVGALQIDRDAAEMITIDGDGPFPLESAARNRLPGVYFERGEGAWRGLDYDESRRFQENPDGRKRPGLQGPIDDAFMSPFLIVVGTGTPWSPELAAWSDHRLKQFQREYDKYLRAEAPVVKDVDLTPEQIDSHNLVLFGDPGSNRVLAKAASGLPCRWDRETIEFCGKQYSTNGHGIALIALNPLNRRRYVVVNSGHTFHEPDFKASNASLYPRLGDAAVLAFQRSGDKFTETVERAEIADSAWKYPSE